MLFWVKFFVAHEMFFAEAQTCGDPEPASMAGALRGSRSLRLSIGGMSSAARLARK